MASNPNQKGTERRHGVNSRLTCFEQTNFPFSRKMASGMIEVLNPVANVTTELTTGLNNAPNLFKMRHGLVSNFALLYKCKIMLS